MGFLDRLTTIIVTATLTSAAWLVAGGTLMQGAGGAGAALPGAQAPDREALGMAPRQASADRGEGGRMASADRDNVVAPTMAAGDLVVPVKGVPASQLTDTFTQARDNGARLHEALDIMAPRGTPVVSAAPGRVEKLFQSDAGGLTVYVRSQDGRTIYYYAHLDSYAQGLAEGQAVKQGTPLGTVGITGNAAPDSPHLHFAIMLTRPSAKWWEPSSAINPYPLLAGK